jgi:hypothetical protein
MEGRHPKPARWWRIHQGKYCGLTKDNGDGGLGFARDNQGATLQQAICMARPKQDQTRVHRQTLHWNKCSCGNTSAAAPMLGASPLLTYVFGLGCLLCLPTEDVPLYWDERWGWGSTWEGPLCAWDTFLSEAASWVKSVSTSPALVIQAKVPRPDPHCLQFEAALDDHLVKQLLYPVCCLSYTGELGPDLGFTHEAPPLPAAGV